MAALSSAGLLMHPSSDVTITSTSEELTSQRLYQMEKKLAAMMGKCYKDMTAMKNQHKKEMAAMKNEHKKEVAAMKNEHKKDMAALEIKYKRELKDYEKRVSDRMNALEALILADCNKYESEAFLFRLAIEEFYRKKRNEIEESKEDEATKLLSLNGLDGWFEEAKARRTKNIWVSAGAGGVIATAGVAVGAAVATVATGVTAMAAAGATFGGIPVVGWCAIAGIGVCLLLAGGMHLYVGYRDWMSREKSEDSKKDK